jgi:hypothetical protein
MVSNIHYVLCFFVFDLCVLILSFYAVVKGSFFVHHLFKCKWIRKVFFIVFVAQVKEIPKHNFTKTKGEGLQPNMTVPPKFKVPKLEKYNGRGDPMIHLQMYCWKMAQYAENESLLIWTFQGTLIGHTAEWGTHSWRRSPIGRGW